MTDTHQHAAAAATRPAAVRRAVVLNRVTLGSNAVEALIALTAGVLAGSISLVGFGWTPSLKSRHRSCPCGDSPPNGVSLLHSDPEQLHPPKTVNSTCRLLQTPGRFRRTLDDSEVPLKRTATANYSLGRRQRVATALDRHLVVSFPETVGSAVTRSRCFA